MMNLGKTIYEQRIKKNLSQTDLANLLNVSRQSVSKWENNNDVPDLEKIIKLSEIFEISLDTLVKGDSPASDNQIKIFKEVIIQEPKREGRKTAGTILFCMAFLVFFLILLLTGSIGGILYSLPFVVCGMICFILKKNVGFWCAWAVYLMFDMFMRWATGITIGLVRLTFSYTADMNYARLAFAWFLLLWTAVMIVLTIQRFMHLPMDASLKNKNLILTGWIAWIGIVTAHQLFIRTETYFSLLTYAISVPAAYTLTITLLDWLRRGTLIILIINTFRYHYAVHQKESLHSLNHSQNIENKI